MFAITTTIHLILDTILADAAEIQSTVIASEERRQSLTQDNPCPGDTVIFICSLNGSLSLVRWDLDGEQLYSFGNPADIGMQASTNVGLIGSLVNATTLTLTVDLSVSSSVMNGTVLSCIVRDIQGNLHVNFSTRLTIIGKN